MSGGRLIIGGEKEKKMADKDRIGVIIVSKGRKEQLERCVNALSLAEGSGLVIVANGRDEVLYAYLRELETAKPGVKCVYLDQRIPKSQARNTGIRQADQEIIYFLDDDSYPANGNIEFISKKFAEHPSVDIIGGPCVTPPGSALFERIAGYAFSEPFTAWKMNERFMAGKKEKICTDSSVTLCNLAFRKKIFDTDKIYFDGRLYYNEENLLLEQYREKGRRLMYCPELVVYHHRRKTITALAEQIYRSGEGRAKMTKIMPKSLRAVYLMPFFFVLYLLSFSFFNHLLYVLPFLAYMMASAANAVLITLKYREKAVALPLLVFLPFIAHVSYGMGFAVGHIRGIYGK